MIGLSGLITPSLDEMVHVAREMEREGFEMPLLIGGATTSAKHTAVKIAPAYHGAGRPRQGRLAQRRRGGAADAARAARASSTARTASSRRSEREAFAKRRQRKLVPYAEALQRRFRIDWTDAPIAVPSFLGARVLRDFPLGEIVPYIDWSPFFMAWELTGKYPQILDDPKVGERGAQAVRRRQTAAASGSSARSC